MDVRSDPRTYTEEHLRELTVLFASGVFREWALHDQDEIDIQPNTILLHFPLAHERITLERSHIAMFAVRDTTLRRLQGGSPVVHVTPITAVATPATDQLMREHPIHSLGS